MVSGPDQEPLEPRRRFERLIGRAGARVRLVEGDWFDAEKDAVLRVLGRVNGNLSKAAELLGISRPTLYDLMHRFGLQRDHITIIPREIDTATFDPNLST